MQSPVYDQIGVDYARHRVPDPRIEAAIHGALGDARRVVNVGAGTGSYEPRNRAVVAVEPSPEMIRQRPRSSAPCIRGSAEALPFEDGEFDAAMAVLTVHHWRDAERGLREMARAAASVVIFTFDPEVHNDFWLFSDYVPAVRSLASAGGAMGVEQIAEIIGADRVDRILIPHDCIDGFGCAYWRRPAAYLDAQVRRCISALALLDRSDVLPGVDRLRHDLATGAWRERHGALLDRETFDGGFRLIVRDAR